MLLVVLLLVALLLVVVVALALLLLVLLALVLLLLLLLVSLVVLVSRASEGARTKVLGVVARYDLAATRCDLVVVRSAHVPRHVPTRSP